MVHYFIMNASKHDLHTHTHSTWNTQHNTIKHSTTQHNTTQHNTTLHYTTQHNTTQHYTSQHNTTPDLCTYACMKASIATLLFEWRWWHDTDWLTDRLACLINLSSAVLCGRKCKHERTPLQTTALDRLTAKHIDWLTHDTDDTDERSNKARKARKGTNQPTSTAKRNETKRNDRTPEWIIY